MRKRGIIETNTFMLIIITVLVGLLIFGVLLIYYSKEPVYSCIEDKGCVLQRVTCCSCEMAGEERCMTKEEALVWQTRLENECQDSMRVCAAVYNCKDVECICKDENCTELEESEEKEFQLANPASIYCKEQGGELIIKENNYGEYGVCVFGDGSECEEWEFYDGKCMPGEEFNVTR